MQALVIVTYLTAAISWWLLRHPVFCGTVVVALFAYLAGGPIALGVFAAVIVVVRVAAARQAAERRKVTGTDAAVFGLHGVLRAVWWLIRHPAISLPITLVVVAGLHGPFTALAAVWLLAGGLVLWWGLWPGSFSRWPGAAGWTAWRSLGYAARWRKVMIYSGLAGKADKTEELPRRLRVRSTRWRDVIRVEMLPAQFPAMWDLRTDGLRNGFRARSCRVTTPEPGFVDLTFLRGDPLTNPIPLPTPYRSAEEVDLGAVRVGLTEEGDILRLPLSGGHQLVGGSTRSGKSSFDWSEVADIAPAIPAGLVELWGIDPRGMELAAGEPLFARYAYPRLDSKGDISPGSILPMVDILKDAARLSLRRGEALHGRARKFVPRPGDPWIVLIIDEIVFFGHIPYPDLRKEAMSALTVLLSQGAGAGVTVIVNTQDPRKESVPSRHFFTSTIALRCREKEEVKLLLGEGAWERGALCDEIPKSMQGVGYVRLDGEREPTRFRAFHVTDNDINRLVDRYAPARLDVIDTTADDESEEVAA